jgi:hypothetical protein
MFWSVAVWYCGHTGGADAVNVAFDDAASEDADAAPLGDRCVAKFDQ